MNTIMVAVLAMAGGSVLGFILCAAAARLRRNAGDKRRRKSKRPQKGKMGVMDKVLIMEAVILVAYTVADMAVFWHTGAEPTTLTACVFGVCGLENGVMGWIKTSKEKVAEPSGSGADGNQEGPEPEREEPPNIGR